MPQDSRTTQKNGYSGTIAELYSLVHEARGKNYSEESEALFWLIKKYVEAPQSLLDVACGTGLHLANWRGKIKNVEGVDLSSDMCEESRRNNPGAIIHQGDMRNLELDGRFDVVTCLFSSTGHMKDITELTAAFKGFRRHLSRGGVVLVEPWWFPEEFLPGYVSSATIKTSWGAVSRASHSLLQGGSSIVDVQYLIANKEEGIKHLRETHTLSLFTLQEHLEAMHAAGLAAEYVRSEQFSRGIFVATSSSE